MDEEDASGSGPHSPCTESGIRSSDGAAAAVELSNVNISYPMGGSETVGAPVTVSSDSVAGGEAGPASVGVVEVKAEMKVTEMVSGKRKRGRPPKDQAKQPQLKMRKEDEEEDVCFICFDGGRLVMCDRRGCPKAYHPVCIKRDEAFFRTRGKWNCGWHICSSCQKTAHYMCYTCTYSLCKACTKYADYVCVRENKGFCTTCMKTIMLIENNGQGNREMVQVDFDDQGSWEYLFKVYWVLLKGKLSLTLDELTQAQNPWKAASTVASKAKSLNVHFGVNDGKVSISNHMSGPLEANKDGTVASKAKSLNVHFVGNDGKVSISDSMPGHLEANKDGTAKSLDVHFGANDGKVSISDSMSGHLEANKAATVGSKAKSLDVHFGGNDGKVSILDSMSGHLEENKAGIVASKAKSLDVHFGGNDGKVSISDSISGHLEANDFDRTKEQLNLPKKGDSPGTDRSISGNNSTSVGTIEWASKELLEFVAHMRNGDIYVLSLFDIQTLLLEYIKIHNLCDPHDKSQIICDLRLRSLFGKPRVGHFEMLKLLEYHCVTKEEPGKVVIQGNDVHGIVSQVEGDGKNDNLRMMDKHKKHKTRRKGDERGPQTNLDEYAAIDVHNIKLIYLRRNLMERLLLDSGKFHDKVVGSFVRIRISSSDLHEDIFRLVEVVGTCKVAVPYNIGDKTADFMLEILNLDKKESISIVAVSSQEFSEDECQRLRQSIKCGLVKRLTVGQVREKALSLQEVRLNDWLGTEIMRFTHLRDRASEKGHKKELRECVEKLELLKTPEERLRMLHEIPEVHTDSNMDPNYQSDKDPGVINCNNKQDENVKSRDIGLNRNGRDPNPNSSLKDDVSYQSGSRSTSSPFCLDKGASSGGEERKNGSLGTDGNAACGSNPIEKPGNQVDSSGSVVGSWNNQVGSFSGVGSEASVASLSTGSAPSTYDSEMDKLWHYRDPIRTIQGPFCMAQLRKWSTTGYFPPDMRIWSVNDEEDHSLLLTDALNGHLCKSMPMGCVSLPIQEVIKGSPDSGHNCDAGRWNSSIDEAVAQSNANSGFVNDIQTGSSYSEQPPAHSFVFTEQSHETSLHQASGHEVQTSSNPGNGISHGNIMHQTTGGQVHENQSISLTVNCSSNNWNPNSGFASVVKSTDLVEQIFGIDINLPSPPAKTSDGDFSGLSTKNLLSVPSNVFVQDLNIPNLPSYNSKPIDGNEKADSTIIQNVSSPLPTPDDEDEKAQAIDDKQFVPLNFTMQIPEVSHKWCGYRYSPTHAKPSFEEWNSSFVSLLKPTEVGNHHAAISTSNCDEISTPSPPHHSSSWLASVTDEPIEISTLAEESVSDLLAEVDAMESQGGGNLASPTSVNGGEDLFHDSKTEYFTSHMPLVGKNDGFASREMIKFPPPQLTLTDDRIRAPSQGFFLDPVKRSSGKASISTKLEFETKPTVPFPTRQYMVDGKQMESGVGGGSTQGNTYAGTGSAQGMPRRNSNTNRGSSSGLIGRDTQSKYSGERLDSKYGGERLVSPRERSVHGSRDCDSGFSKGRLSYGRHLSFGSSGGTTTVASSGGGDGGYSRPPPKEQRVCKFYESGYCRKGSSCSYFHPG